MPTQNLQNSRIDNGATRSQDFHQRQIRNAAPATEPYDYVVLKQLHDLGSSLQDQIKTSTPTTIVPSTRQVALAGFMTFGLDMDTSGINVIGKYGNIQVKGSPSRASISCVTPPASSNLIIDVKFSHDNTSTWNTIFKTGNPFTYTTAMIGIHEFTAIFASVTFAVGDLFRIDVIQSGGAAGITGTVQWS